MISKRKIVMVSLIIASIAFIAAIISLFIPVSPCGIYCAAKYAALHEGSEAICIMTQDSIFYIFEYSTQKSQVGSNLTGEWFKGDDGFFYMKYEAHGQTILKKMQSYWWGLKYYEDPQEPFGNDWYAFRAFAPATLLNGK